MNIRKYQSKDCKEIAELFYNTVHSINAKDYTPYQLDAWATGFVDEGAWDKSFTENYTVVCQLDQRIIGFGDINIFGYLDKLYVHQNYQRFGVASLILCSIEEYAIRKGITLITTHSSITAKPFFEKQGFKTIKKQEVIRNNQNLTNFVMEKYL